MPKENKTATEAFEKALKQSSVAFEEGLQNNQHYTLRLFVSGMTTSSIRAIQNLEQICKQDLAGRFQLEIIDIYQHPELARKEQIVAVPTLIKKIPMPLRRFIGDLSEKENLLVGLDILPEKKQDRPPDKT